MIALDFRDKRPINEQVTEKISRLIICGALPPGSKLPSVRSLAIDLSVNANTIQRAYSMLEASGYIYTVIGRGNFVSEPSAWKQGKFTEVNQKIMVDCREAKNAGMSAEEIKKIVDLVFNEKGEDND